MSSHHFVKEGQEPALLILDALSLELAEPLLEWAPLVIVADTALDKVLLWGIKIDVVLIAANRMEEMTIQLSDQFPLEIISYHDQYDVLSAAFDFLMDKKQKAVNIMSGTSQSMFEILNRFTQKIQLTLFNQEIKWLCITSGQYQKWLPAKSQLKIQTEDRDIDFSGLHPQQGYWETENDGMVTIKSNPVFWIGEMD